MSKTIGWFHNLRKGSKNLKRRNNKYYQRNWNYNKNHKSLHFSKIKTSKINFPWSLKKNMKIWRNRTKNFQLKTTEWKNKYKKSQNKKKICKTNWVCQKKNSKLKMRNWKNRLSKSNKTKMWFLKQKIHKLFRSKLKIGNSDRKLNNFKCKKKQNQRQRFHIHNKSKFKDSEFKMKNGEYRINNWKWITQN